MVAFNSIPGNTLTPFFFAEFNSGGSPFDGNPRLLLIGQKLAAGSATAAAPIGPIQSQMEADALFGVGSMLSDMFRYARLAAPTQPIWALPLADPAGAAAGGSYSITAAPGATGAGVLYIMGKQIAFQINAADTAATVATNLAAAVNAAGLPVTAAVDGTTNTKVNVTARHVGTVSNSILLEIAKDQPNALLSTNTTVVAMTGGTGVPALDTPFANCGDTEFDFVAGPYSDSVSLDSVKAFMAGRWNYARQIYGGYFSTSFGTLSALVTLGNARNDPHASIMGSQASPSPLWQWAASIAAVACVHLGSAPEVSRPLQTLELPGILPPRDRSLWWAIADRQALYADGIAAYKVAVDGTVLLDRQVTTYQQTAAGVPDATLRDVETLYQAMYAIRYLKSAVSNNHARQSLADENPYNIPEMATPKSIRNTVIHAYNDLVALGVAENADVFASNVVVQRNASDATRVDVYFPVDFVNQLRIVAVNVTAFLQYATASGDTGNVAQ